MKPNRLVIDRIEQTLLDEGPGHPHFERTKDEIWITEQPGRQFEVRAIAEDGEITITTEKWHGHFDDDEQAMQCFMWLLTPYYRLVEVFVEDQRLLDRLERYGQEGWEDLGEVYYLDPTEPSTRALADRPSWRYVVWQQKLAEVPGGFRNFLPLAELDDNDLPPETVLVRREFDGPPESFNWADDIPQLNTLSGGKPSLGQQIRNLFRR